MTALVGANNSGKSSFLQAIQFGVSIVQSLSHSSSKSHPKTGTLSTDQLIYTPLRDVHTLAQGGQLRQGAGSQIQIDFFEEGKEVRVAVRRGKNKNISVSIDGDASLIERIANLENPYSVIAPGLAGIPSVEEFRSPGMVRRAAARGDANSVFRNVLWILKQDHERWLEFKERLGALFPNSDIDVLFDENNDEHLRATNSRGGLRLPIDASGTGVLQAAQVLSYVGVYRPALLILDEPDSHLHPNNQRSLIRLLDEVAERESFQVILSTHSRHMLDECIASDCQVHWMAQGARQEGPFQVASALLGLGALDVAERVRSGQVSTVVLTEDSNTKYLWTLLNANGRTEDECAVLSYNGCTSFSSAKLLADYIRQSSPGMSVIIHRDRDYLSDVEVAKAVEKYETESLAIYWTPGTDIESDFLSVDHVGSVYGDLGLADELLREATEQVRTESIRLLTNSRTSDALSSGTSKGDFGGLYQSCEEEYDSDPIRYRHGKKVLKQLNRIAQDRLGKSKSLAVVTNALHRDELMEDSGPASG